MLLSNVLYVESVLPSPETSILQSKAHSLVDLLPSPQAAQSRNLTTPRPFAYLTPCLAHPFHLIVQRRPPQILAPDLILEH